MSGTTIINARTLRNDLRRVLERVRRGQRFIVLYRSRPTCRIVPVDESAFDVSDLADESLYGAKPVGSSTDGGTAADHDEFLYGRRPK